MTPSFRNRWSFSALWSQAGSLEHYAQMMIQVASAATAFIMFQVLAHRLGASLENDAFSTAYAVTGRAAVLLMNIVVIAWIPFLIATTGKSRLTAISAEVATSIWIILGVAALLTLLAVCEADVIAGIAAEGMSPQGQAITARLLRLFAPLLFLQCAMAIGAGILNVRGHFLFAASGRLIMNLAAVAAILLAPAVLTDTIAIGLFGGGLVYLFLMGWFCRGDLRPMFRCRPHAGRYLGLLGFNALTLVVQACFAMAQTVVFRRCANGVGTGCSTALTLALGVSGPFLMAASQLVVRAYPEVVRASHAGPAGRPHFRKLGQQIISQATRICVPISLVLFFLRRPICYVLFHKGAFDADATEETAAALGAYTLAILVFTVDGLFDRVLLTLRRYNVMITLSIIEFGALAGFGAVLSARFGALGIAGAHVLAMCLRCGTSGTYLATRGWLSLRFRARPAVAQFVAAAAMATVLFFGVRWTLTDMTLSHPALIARGIALGAVGIAAFVLPYMVLSRSLPAGGGDAETASEFFEEIPLPATDLS
jgi:putative peptidoglycan lipid II flippase